MNSYEIRFKLWQKNVKHWAELNNLTELEAYKFLKLIYWKEISINGKGWRDLKWAEFDIFMQIIEQEKI